MRILVAEDSATMRHMLKSAVEGLGHECIAVADGAEAWERLRDDPVEVVISDWLMPVMDGEELCRRIRADPDAPYTYFVMLTSLEEPDYIVRGMEAGADDYLTKPLDRHQLEVRLIAAARVTALHHRLVRQQRAIQREIELAAGVQRGLLPERPPVLAGAEVAGLCAPAADVGGDYFDFVLDDRRRLMLLVADVAGHSVGSALLMAMARGSVRRGIADGGSPAAVLRSANADLHADLVNAGLFITMFCACFDPETGGLAFANAGHNPPLLRQADGRIEELDADGAALGILSEVEFEERSVALAPGDRLLLYTDGAVEAVDPGGEPFGEDRLRRVVDDGTGTAEQLVEDVLRAVESHLGDGRRQDDITLVALAVGRQAAGESDAR